MNLIEHLAGLQRVSQVTSDESGRVPGSSLAICTQNVDPKNLRRILVSDPTMPNLNSSWIRRSLGYPHTDPPLPAIGSTVLVTYLDGDPTIGWYQSVVNATNPPLEKEDPLLDHREKLPGARITTIQKSDQQRIELDKITSTGLSMTLKCDGGAVIKMFEDGTVELSDVAGNKIKLGGASGVAITALSNVTINGKSVATIGALDTGGDTLISRGW
jgi:hypothetical protein